MDADQKIRLCVVDIESGKVQAMTDEEINPQWPILVSPDGKSVGCLGGGGWRLFEVEKGMKASTLEFEGIPIQWCADGHWIFVLDKDSVSPWRVFRLNLDTGRKEPWAEFSIPDVYPFNVVILPTPDGKSYVYGYDKYSADLFIAEGLK
jgi:hypothetical protein